MAHITPDQAIAEAKAHFTPGPWTVEQYGPDTSIVCRDGGRMDGATIAHRVCQHQGNARLIARAPAMYAALLTCLDALRFLSNEAGDVLEWNEGGIACNASREVRAAIAGL